MVSAGEGTVERVTLTTDDATRTAVEDIVAILRAQGFAVERRAFIRASAEEPRRVVLLALERPLPALVALVAPPNRRTTRAAVRCAGESEGHPRRRPLNGPDAPHPPVA